MYLPKIKRDLNNFIKDEKGTMTKKNILKAGIAFGTLIGLSQNVFAGHDNHTDHNNNLALNYADPEGVGTHTHHTQHTNVSWDDSKDGGKK